MSSAFNTESSDMEGGKLSKPCECEGCLNEGECCATTEGMPGSDCDCEGCANGGECCATLGDDEPPKLTLQAVMEELERAVGKIEFLNNKVKAMENTIESKDSQIKKQLKLIHALQSDKEGNSSNSDKSLKSLKKDSSRSKHERVDDEKERQFKLLQGKLRDLDADGSKRCGSEESSDDGVDLKTIKKKMTRKQRDLCNRKVAARLKGAGGTFPEDDFETSSSSGTDTDSDSRSRSRRKCRHSRQVKSGAKIKKRPVIRTELWPHTIANEDDGEDLTCENISLAKFFSCFA